MNIKMFEFNEDKILDEAAYHIATTYSGHYSGGIQTTEFIMSNASSFDWLTGNVIKYVSRYGRKEGRNRKDLLKAIHYITLMIYYGEKDVSKTS